MTSQLAERSVLISILEPKNSTYEPTINPLNQTERNQGPRLIVRDIRNLYFVQRVFEKDKLNPARKAYSADMIQTMEYPL